MLDSNSSSGYTEGQKLMKILVERSNLTLDVYFPAVSPFVLSLIPPTSHIGWFVGFPLTRHVVYNDASLVYRIETF